MIDVLSIRHALRRPKATTAGGEAKRAPFPLGRLCRPWMEQSFARIAEQRFTVDALRRDPESAERFTKDALETFESHWTAASSAAGSRFSRGRGGAVERVASHLDAVDSEILRLAPPHYVYGRLPGVLAEIKRQLPARDARVQRITALMHAPAKDLPPHDRDLIVAAQQAASAEARRQVRRLSSFTRVLYATAVVLAVGALAFAAVGAVAPRSLPVCFNPVDGVVCPTAMSDSPKAKKSASEGQPKPVTPAVDTAMRTHADHWDIALIEGVGLLAAAVAAAGALSRIRGTSTPFTVPLALAVLKLPTGALTAILGLLLMRGGFVPGLGALDTPAQIIAWAIVLGYSQQLLTQFVDRQAQSELNNFGRSEAVRKQDELAVAVGLSPLDDATSRLSGFQSA
jgi:hypothetical protein